jgi:dienelactone hydrolase
MQIWSSEIKELTILYESFKGQLPELEKELERLVKADDENMILLYSRRCLEVIITDLCECELKRDRGTEPLKGIIDKLHKEKKIPSYIIASMHGLNELSTFGTHPKDFDPEQVKPVLNNLDIIIKWYLKYKNIRLSYRQKQEFGENQIIQAKKRRLSLSVKPGLLIPGIVVALIVLGIFTFFLNRYYKIRLAKESLLPEVERFYNENNQIGAFDLLQKSEKYISDNPEFKKWESKIVKKITFLTYPPGATVFIRQYSDTAGVWKKLGITPIDSLKMPNGTYYQVMIEKPGYEKVMAVVRTEIDTLFRRLFRKEELPSDMVYVEGYRNEVNSNFLERGNGFFIDRFEVTNKQFKEFIDNGGYKKPEYWENEFINDGKRLSFEQAITCFTDNTGRPGPFGWEAGYYPTGTDDYPVTGVSWYEAAAYAEYAGKSLPTAEHWKSAFGLYLPGISWDFGSKIIPLSNFTGIGPAPVGKFRGMSCFGAYDMAGNVREWCWNKTLAGNIIRGGAWNDANYLYADMSQVPSFDRSPKNGFRCVKYIDTKKIPPGAFDLITYTGLMDWYSGDRDYSREKPVSDNEFRIFSSQFLYDKTDLNASTEERIESYNDWTIEKVTFNASYGYLKERMIAYLFLPKNVSPPFQTVIFWPGINTVFEKKLIMSNWESDFDFILKSGRAVMYPVYKGTFERNDGPVPKEGHELTDWTIKLCKDFKRAIDYLETRKDIDTTRLGFYGISWGGSMGGMIPAIENRLKVNILIIGGFNGQLLPEVHAINYVSRVKIPTLMLNGKYDLRYNIDLNVKPFFELLGTPKDDKRHKIYETDHWVQKNEIIKETLNWLDKYLGPVK